MDWITGLFYLFSALLLTSAFKVISARNTVHATLYLMLAFFQAAMIWMLLKVEFLAITLVLVYLGAVMVLFLFVVMMLDIDLDAMRAGFWKNLPLAAVLGALMAAEIGGVVYGGFAHVTALPDMGGANTHALGMLLYTHYLYPLEIAAVLLLVAIVSAIALTLRTRKDSKFVDAALQIRTKKADRLRIVKMSAVGAPPANAAEESSS